MASIFKNRLVAERLKGYEVPDFEKRIGILQQWLEAHASGRLKSKGEREVEQEFIQSIFVDVLGYTRFPENPTTLIPQGKTMTSGQKPDVILGYFEDGMDNEKVAAVCEIKDANTPLDKSQRREGSLTPVQQAFKYRTQYQKCDFVIATNFVEIRLLQDNELNYESWTLESLCNKKNDYFEFRKFFYLMCRENFVSKRGKSTTLQLLSDIQVEQESITKSFYKEYKELRQKLIKNILKNNEEAKKRDKFYELAVEKAQKIIDRLVFVAFCEDLGLLPENILRKVIESDNQTFGSTWDTLKVFFNAVDKGSEKLGNAQGYNGELFKPDSQLDALVIDDEICREFLNIGKYDFGEDLSVNILGHIFEQSISDLEELKSIGSLEEFDSKKSKRKKDGIFYTPEYIVDYIVQNSVGAWLKDREKEILDKHGVKESLKDKNYEKRHREAYEEYQLVLQEIKVLDPACGSGAFLVKVFDYLLEENRRVGEILGGLFNTDEHFKSILQNNIYGVDLNSESVEITKLSLWLKTAQRGKKLASLNKNIKCGNSLIDDPEVAGKKAFKWEDEFKEIMDAGGFDVVVGNPPYVRQELLGQVMKEVLTTKFPEVGDSIADLYVYFFGLALSLLKKDGLLGFITPNKWMERKYGSQLRSHLSKLEIKLIVNYGELKIFADASTETAIYVVKNKISDQPIKYARIENLTESQYPSNYSFSEFKKDEFDSSIWRFIPEQHRAIVKKFTDKTADRINLSEYTNNGIKYGIKTGNNSIFIIDEKVKEKLESKDPNSREIIVPLIEGDDFADWHLLKQDKYLLSTGFDIDIPTLYPAVHEYLEEYIEVLKERCDKGKNYWNLRSCDYYNLLEKPKIVFYHTALHHSFYYDEENHYISANCYFIANADRYLQCVLNSSLFQFAKRYLFPSFGDPQKGGRMRLDANKMREVLIIKPSKSLKAICEKLAKEISLSRSQLQKLISRFKALVISEFSLEKWPNRLNNFWILNFEGFLEGLSLKKTKLSILEKDELFQLFHKYKEQLSDLDLEARAIQNEIDKIIFDLYELTDEERSIVLKHAS